MRLYHWVAIVTGGALLTASAAAVVLSTQNSTESGTIQTAAAKSDRNAKQPLVRESQLRQTQGSAPAGSGPQRVETTKYDSWVVTCRENVGGAGKKNCSAQLQAVSQDRRQVLLDWQIMVNKDGHFVTAFFVPPVLGIRKGDRVESGPLQVQNGIELKFGNGPARRISYIWCGPKQCFAEALIDDAFVKEALANTKATITVHMANGDAVPMELPIKGVDKAISATRK
jgi:invasion protein IalB